MGHWSMSVEKRGLVAVRQPLGAGHGVLVPVPDI